MDVIETHGLTKEYGRKRAVDELDMHVRTGDIYGFVGRNGAGKSTTMKMVAGLVEPTAGEISLFGKPISRDATPSRVGSLIESPDILPNMSAFDNLMAKALAVGVAGARHQCEELLCLFGLKNAGEKRAKGLSLGMRQRLGVALALVGTPDLLLLDEPFNGLDPEATRALRNTLVELNRERGVTIVVSSHVLDQLERMATRYGVIRSGHMADEFTEEELHEACGSSVRVRTTDTSRALAVLEQSLPKARFRADPDGSVLVSGATAEDVSRILHEADAQVLELAMLERDIEDYFVDLMSDDGEGE